MKYRAEIDGLRALAVLPVILFHAGFEWFGGGFVGVDVFFVISGYLITLILIDEISENNFSIVNFYERRARRILPTLFFVMLCCIPFAWLWMLPSEIESFSQSLAAVSLFFSNVMFLKESGYFAAAAEEKPLLHTWSLAVEEQYYVVFPLFLLFMWRFGRHRVFWSIAVIAALSLALSEWGWRNKPADNFYLAFTRAWELLAGSLAAFVVQRKGVQSNNVLAALGLGAIIFSIFAYDESIPFPSVYSLVPILGVVLLILFADKKTIVAKILSTKILVGVGLVSYSAYLWHQPLFAFARIQSSSAPSPYLMMILAVTSILLAILSWKFIEQPFRHKNFIGRRGIFISSAVVGAFFIVIGLVGVNYQGEYEKYWLSKQTDSVQDTYHKLMDTSPKFSNFGDNEKGEQLLGECRFNLRAINSEVEENLLKCADKHGKGVLILGDSHAKDLYGVVTSRFENPFIAGFSKGGCRPNNQKKKCYYEKVISFVKDNPQVFGKVIYEQAGFYLLEKTDGTKGSRLFFEDLALTQTVENIVPDYTQIREIREYLQSLSEFVSVVWLLPRAEPHISVRDVLKLGCNNTYAFRPNQYETFIELDNAIANEIDSMKSKKLSWLSQNAIFQFDLSADYIDCENLYWSDGDHFSVKGEIRFGERLPSNFLTQ